MEQERINSVKTLANIAGEIHGLERQNIVNVIRIGRLLREAQKCCPHGEWGEWIAREFEWSDQTARRYIRAYKLSKRFDLTGLDLSISALHILAELDAAHPAVEQILALAQWARVTKKAAMEIVKPPLPEVQAPPVAPKEPRPKQRNSDRARASLFSLCRALKYPLKDWEDAAQSVPPVQLRTIIDRLEMIYQTRTASRFEDA